MARPVLVLGIGANGMAGLSPDSRAAIAEATFLAGGKRHLELVAPVSRETLCITNNLDELSNRLRGRGPDERCVVLASGDPLFYGIGHRLGLDLGPGQLVVEPALSSMQLAFARLGMAWHDAAIASVHGRVLADTMYPLLGRAKIGLFTRDGSSPSEVAAFVLDRGPADYLAWVAESLGTAEERVTHAPLAELVGRRFGDLNVMILARTDKNDSPRERLAGIPDAEFAQPDVAPVLLTHADVRAVTLARFQGIKAVGPIWDIGAGLGGIAIELARAFPSREVVAVEQSSKQLPYLRENRLRFEAYNLRIIEGTAPDCLNGERPPAGVFVGGSGGRLGPILDLVLGRLQAGGMLVANFVGLENLSECLDRLKRADWPGDVAQVQVSQGRPLAGLTTFVPLRPVWVVRASNG